MKPETPHKNNRSGALGLVADVEVPEGAEEEAVSVVTKLEEVDGEAVYQIAFANDEGEAFEDFAEGDEYGEEEPVEEAQAQPQFNKKRN